MRNGDGRQCSGLPEVRRADEKGGCSETEASHGCAVGCLCMVVLIGILGVGGWLTEVTSKMLGGVDVDGEVGPLQIVRCTFKTMSADSAAKIRKGDKLVVSGKVYTSMSMLGVSALQLVECKIEE